MCIYIYILCGFVLHIFVDVRNLYIFWFFDLSKSTVKANGSHQFCLVEYRTGSSCCWTTSCQPKRFQQAQMVQSRIATFWRGCMASTKEIGRTCYVCCQVSKTHHLKNHVRVAIGIDLGSIGIAHEQKHDRELMQWCRYYNTMLRNSAKFDFGENHFETMIRCDGKVFFQPFASRCGWKFHGWT